MKKAIIIIFVSAFLMACAGTQVEQRQVSFIKISGKTYKGDTVPGGIMTVFTHDAVVSVDHSATLENTAPPEKSFLSKIWGAFATLFKAAGDAAL